MRPDRLPLGLRINRILSWCLVTPAEILGDIVVRVWLRVSETVRALAFICLVLAAVFTALAVFSNSALRVELERVTEYSPAGCEKPHFTPPSHRVRVYGD